MTPFYIEQRKRLALLIDSKDKPLHGKWTFDTENRLKLPKSMEVPEISMSKENEYVIEAKEYINKNFSENVGETSNFIFPINHNQALRHLHNFLEQRLNNFGPYEDALSQTNDFNFHSLLSSSINIGLLTPNEVIDETIRFSENNKVNFQSLEGFIRQIIGWREFMMIVYEREGVKERTSNYFNHKKKLPSSFYNGTTGIKPVDDIIKKVLKYGYTHHIERLMILGNFMCLCEIDPNDIYQWFMEMYIDSYDWVMVPNVYGMSQFADGGLITTKPYISSSNYILKMSDYKKDDWCEIWDGLFWRFLHKNKEKIASNSRIGMLVKSNDFSKVKDKIKIANQFLENLN
jgi:deoxyribodipyrimidine photolyase-related protein